MDTPSVTAWNTAGPHMLTHVTHTRTHTCCIMFITLSMIIYELHHIISARPPPPHMPRCGVTEAGVGGSLAGTRHTTQLHHTHLSSHYTHQTPGTPPRHTTQPSATPQEHQVTQGHHERGSRLNKWHFMNFQAIHEAGQDTRHTRTLFCYIYHLFAGVQCPWEGIQRLSSSPLLDAAYPCGAPLVPLWRQISLFQRGFPNH